MSRRVEEKLGPRLKVHAVIDPDEKRARAALAGKKGKFVEASYANTTPLPNVEAYADLVRHGKAPRPK